MFAERVQISSCVVITADNGKLRRLPHDIVWSGVSGPEPD